MAEAQYEWDARGTGTNGITVSDVAAESGMTASCYQTGRSTCCGSQGNVMPRPTSNGKYNAKRTKGYASKREYAHAVNLHALERAGEIKDLRERVSYELIPKDELGRAIRYVADFCYWDKRTGRHIVQDVKGFRTDVYKLKRRLMWRVHGIIIEEV